MNPADMPNTTDLARGHVGRLASVLADPALDAAAAARWGARLGPELAGGARLLVAGNGGSAAEGQHLTAELVGRFREDRRPLSALALHAETSSCTAIGNDYGAQEVFARQIEAHGRPGDTVLLLSTSGASPNVLHAAARARRLGLRVLACTGRMPNPLALVADEALAVPSDDTCTVQEIHLIAVHVLCEALDASLGSGVPAGDGPAAGVPADVAADVPADVSADVSAEVGAGGAAGVSGGGPAAREVAS